MKKSILGIITEYSVNEGMDNILLQDEEYMKIQKEINKQTDQFDKLDLTKEQRLIVDNLISAYNGSGAYDGVMNYKKGFRDCVKLLQEMNFLKVS